MKSFVLGKQAAVTLTELLVVLVIISILSTVAMPVAINYTERARVSAARLEVFEIAQAEEAVGAVHGFYVPLQVLDDLPGEAGVNAMPGDADTIGDYGSNVFVIDFNVPISELLTTSQPILSAGSSDPRVSDMVENWQGPFINYQRFYDVDDDPDNQNKEDFPLDPWNNPYRFYGPRGLIGTSRRGPSFSQSDFNGQMTIVDQRFDRWAIVSWGPSGEPDTSGVTAINDDIIFTFGLVRAETEFNI